MSRMATLRGLMVSMLAGMANCLASTDTITWGGDNSRASYQTNHNMDPSIVASDDFAQLFRTTFPGNYNGAAEQVFSQPLVYTPSDGVQYLYVATTQNNVYKLNAKTGAIVASRNLHIPFLTADLDGCVDINPAIGVTSTGVIDPDTGTLYLTAKTYADQGGGNGPQGRPNGRYYVHALDVNDLSERPNFPVNLEGTLAKNSPIRSFNGGIQHQRPALLHTGQFVYAGFASHCVQYNFSGWIIGWDKTTGAIVERWATEGDGVPNTTPGGGIWMSGGGLASDDAGSMFFATGNGYASQLADIPVAGRNPPTALEEAAVHMTINSDGSLTIVDFFMPFEKQALDGADKDLGTSPLELLPSQFACGDVKRIGVVTGKSGKTYWLNLDDLGGYRIGPSSSDNVLQVYQNENSVYAGAGVYPLEGGYIYINVINYPSHVFKFSCDDGVPSFTKVADAPVTNAGILGVGHGTVTSLNDQVGTGLVWISDVRDPGLRVYKAVPEGGSLTLVKSFSAEGITKFTRPVFGDGIVYLGTTQGYIYGFGAPTTSPVNCSSPVGFGNANIGATAATRTITCTAKIALTLKAVTLNSTEFSISGLPTTPVNVAAGSTFTFQASFSPTTVGLLTASVMIATTNNVAGYSTNSPVTLTGTGQSPNALFSVNPTALNFDEIITGDNANGVEQSAIFSNQGNAVLTVNSIKYSQTSASGPYVSPTASGNGTQVGPFTFLGLPSTIAANTDVAVEVNFNPPASGNYSVYVVVSTSGGDKTLTVTASSGPAPVALLQFQSLDGSSWVTYETGKNFTFGNVTENTTRSLKLRLTNSGGDGAVALSVTVSKPPFGVSGIIGANNQVDLAEGTTLGPGESATATLYCSVPKEQWNSDPYRGDAQWTMNLNDPNWGKQWIQFFCQAVSEQAPPLRADGLGQYRYSGCYKENNPGRQLQTQLYGNSSNTNAMCIAACSAGGYKYCGTQYESECWAGNTIPTLQVSENDCNYACAGDLNEICGGNGVGEDAGLAFISLFANPNATGSTGGGNPGGGGGGGSSAVVNPGVDGFVSLGCYAEPSNGRALSNQVTTANKTVAACITACESQYSYIGLEYGGECWCGTSLAFGSTNASASDCNMACNGNSTELCGGPSRLNLYTKNGTIVTPPEAPSIKQTVGSYHYQGCWTEATNGRALASTTYADDSMTLESCAAFCSTYIFFGYCGNDLAAGSVNATNQGDCSMLCKGNDLEFCGAGSRLSLYLKGASVSSSAASSSTALLSSTSKLNSVSSSTTSRPSSSSSSSLRSLTSSSLTTYTSSSSSSSSSSPSLASSSLTRTSSATSSSSSVRSTSATPSPSSTTSSRSTSLGSSTTHASSTSYSSTLTTPTSRASSTSSSIATSSSSTSRFTSSTISSTSSKSSSPTTTSRPTSSSPTPLTISSTSSKSSSSTTTSLPTSSSPTTSSASYSSTASRVSSSSSKSSSTSSAPVATYTGPPVVSQGNVNFTYYGCAKEPSAGRLMPNLVKDTQDMTIEKCLGLCWMYDFAGVEYGGECWCGQSLNFPGNQGATPGANVTDSQCSMLCRGNSTEYCGAGLRLSLYYFDAQKAAANADR